MLFKFIIDLFLALPCSMISLIPVVNCTLPDNIFATASVIFAYAGYFMPVDGLMTIILLGLALDNTHLIWSIILRIKSFIPTMGD